MEPSDRSSLIAHVRSTIHASRGVRDAYEIKRLLSDGKRQLDYLRNTMWMAK
jgi:hypothetical protein